MFDGHTIANDKEYMKQYMKQVDETVDIHTTKNHSDEDMYRSLLDNLFETYKAKNSDYGNAFAEMFDELGIDYAYGKLREKMNRIKTLRNQPNMVENEGLEDALLDTAGYAILTLVELKKRIMVNLNECKRNKTEQEAQDAIVEKFIEDTMHLVEIADRQVIDYIDTHIPLPYGLKQ